MDVCSLRDRDNFFFRGAWFSIADVVFNGVVKQDRILWNDANGRTYRGLGHMAQILTVDANGAPLDIVKTEQQTGQRRFT